MSNISNEFQLGDWLVNLETGVLIDGNSKKQIPLEPQQSQLLRLLVQHNHKVVSRDQIAENVWRDLVVEDNTISKAITRLRKALNDDPKKPQYIKTIPKRGYSLIAAIKPKVSNCLEGNSDSGFLKTGYDIGNRKFQAFWFCAFLLASLGAWHQFKSISSQEKVLYESQPLTNANGQEYNGSWSKDASQFVYTLNSGTQTALYLKKEYEAEPHKLVNLNNRKVYADWSPTEDKIVYSDYDGDGRCIVWKIENLKALIVEPKKITECGSGRLAMPKWSSDGRAIYYIADNDLFRLDMQSNASKVLESTYDDEELLFVAPSPDGRWLAVLNKKNQQYKVGVYSLPSTRKKDELVLSHSIESFTWNKDSNALLYVGRHPSKSIIEHKLQGKPFKLVSAPFGYLDQVSDMSESGKIMITGSDVDLDVLEKNKNSIDVIIDSSFPDYNPKRANLSGLIAFASKRSGSAQIWIKNSINQYTQLSKFIKSHYIYDIIWSPNDELLLVKTEQEIYLFDVKQKIAKKLRYSSSEFEQIGWLSNDIFYAVTSGEKPNRLVKFSTDINKNVEELKTNISTAQYYEGKWYIQNLGEQVIYEYSNDLSDRNLWLTILPSLKNSKWRVMHQQIYFIQSGSTRKDTLIKILPDNKPMSLLQRANISFANVQALENGNILFSKVRRDEANLVALTPIN